MTTDEPRYDRWGGTTTEDRIVAAFAALNRAVAAQKGLDPDEDETRT